MQRQMGTQNAGAADCNLLLITLACVRGILGPHLQCLTLSPLDLMNGIHGFHFAIIWALVGNAHMLAAERVATLEHFATSVTFVVKMISGCARWRSRHFKGIEAMEKEELDDVFCLQLGRWRMMVEEVTKTAFSGMHGMGQCACVGSGGSVAAPDPCTAHAITAGLDA